MNNTLEIRSSLELHLAQGQYDAAIVMCEQAIESDPAAVAYYWYLGLALLLQGQEAEAQLTWMTPLLEADPEQAEQWIAELVDLLSTAAAQQEARAELSLAWLLRRHIQEYVPDRLSNLLHLLQLELKTDQFSYDDGLLAQIAQQLKSIDLEHQSIDLNLVLSIVQQLLRFNAEHLAFFQFLEACIPAFATAQRTIEFANFLIVEAHQFRQTSRYTASIHLAKFCARLAPTDSTILLQAISLMQSDSDSMIESLPLTERLIELATDVTDRIMSTHSMLSSLMMTCGAWSEIQKYYHLHQSLLAAVTAAPGPDLYRLLSTGLFFHYFADEPQQNRPLRNQIGQLSQEHYRSLIGYTPQPAYPVRSIPLSAASSRPLKIGYLSECLRLHSVGWLVRWLLWHHDRQQFEVHLYSTRQSHDPIQRSFIQQYQEYFHPVSTDAPRIADQIQSDEIDILVDLDSLTSFSSCATLALKPAPIQVSWLGFDASGIPAVDYFIADPYVLPDDAQDYYSEKIWRLPQTYIAVDGFEVGIPDLRRDRLGIPSDAVVYLSSQSGLKRNPDNIRLQLRILKAVPNSYFLIKSFNAQSDSLAAFFKQLAEEEGVSFDRLRFLPDVADNSTYRANLAVADVILDTYPYNGATTTLEALWMGLPIVTRVGQQFAARNSYTMLKNVGIQEGIAWSDAEYLEWGIRLGQDAQLRRSITYRLQQSRHSAPLWNAHQFTREMEAAYEQMARQGASSIG